MRQLLVGLIATITLLFLGSPTQATDYYVAGDTGNDTTGNGSSGTPWKTIQKAADTMVAGDTVNVKGGVTYSTGKNDCSFWGLKAATVCLTRSGTVNSYITYQAWQGTGTPIIQPTGGYFGPLGFGLSSSTTTVNYIRINGFLVKNAGTGIDLGGIGNIITNNTIIDTNHATGTIGIRIGVNESDTAYVYNNTIYQTNYGIGVFAGYAVIKNNNIVNTTSYGIYNNVGPWEAIELDYNNVYGSSTLNYSIGLLPIGSHSLSLNPEFIDPNIDDFRLNVSSPLVDAGLAISAVTTDIEGSSRPQQSAYDIGAYESSFSQPNPPNVNPASSYSTPLNSLTELAIFTGEPELTDGNAQFAMFNSFSSIAMGDVNGDGYDDFTTGARHYNPSGGMYVFFGKQSPANTDAAAADVIYRSSTQEHGFAENLSIGDLDGDGINDILATNYGISKAYIFKGSSTLSSGTVTSATATITGSSEFGFGSTILGDVNGDSYADYAIRDNGSPSKIYVYLGDGTIADKTSSNASFTITTGSNTVMLSRPGDINHDGYADIMFSCPQCSGNAGKIYAFMGKSTGFTNRDYTEADVTFTGVSGNSLGSWISLADVNGDAYDDILSAGRESISIFYGATSMANKTADAANVIISASDQFADNRTLAKSVVGVDMNNDGYGDVAFSSSVGPKTYVVYGGPNLVSKNASQADLVFDAISAWGAYYGGPMETGDMNGDGYADIGIGAGMYNIRQGRAYILTAPHGSPSITLNGIGNTNSLTLRGTVTDTLPVGGVEVSVDNGSWISCSGTSSFQCLLPSTLSDGAHTLRARSKNSLGVYMATREYTTTSFTFDKTSPQVEWTDASGSSKRFESLGGDNIYTEDTLPTFTFSKSKDTTSGLSRYEVLVDGVTYLTGIDPSKPSDKDYREDDDKYVSYKDDQISVRAKKESSRLLPGSSYKWKVRVIDQAGNALDTKEKVLRLKTHAANFSGVFFPISLLSIGGKDTNITTLHEDQVPLSFSISSTTPTFYGIAPALSKLTLRLEVENKEGSGREVVYLAEATANDASRFGINIKSKLLPGRYYVLLSGTNPQGDYVELPEFTLKLTSYTAITTPKPHPKAVTTVQEVLKTSEEVAPPTSPKRCFLWWCW